MRKWLIIGSVVTICISVLLLSGGVAFALTSVEGFNGTILAIIQLVGEQTSKGLEAILEAFGMILP